MAPITLPIGPTAVSVKVQPVVLLNICDSFIRRNEGQVRVIGALLGTVTDNVVDVKNCYAVPHNESAEQVSRQAPSGFFMRHVFIVWFYQTVYHKEGTEQVSDD
jgi:hypothetical protein